ncbi:MAG: SH3 domain-containing protein [Firmicutes bacterium]|nr:SH3 domain-containing protein [Bacillota bacterium]
MMRKRILPMILMCCVLLTPFALDAAYGESQGNESGVIVGGEARLLEGAWNGAAVVGSVPAGERVVILIDRSDWFKVRHGSAEGWVHKQSVEYAYDIPYVNGVVLCETLTVRDAPSVSAKKVATLSTGEYMTIYDARDGWYQVHFGQGMGWVLSDYVLETPMGSEIRIPKAGLTAYAAPSLRGKKVGMLDYREGMDNQWLPCIGEIDDFWIVSLRGACAFIYKKNVE